MLAEVLPFEAEIEVPCGGRGDRVTGGGLGDPRGGDYCPKVKGSRERTILLAIETLHKPRRGEENQQEGLKDSSNPSEMRN